ncbi:MAG: lipase family protein, partial [Rubripirellula sp.]
RYINFVKLEHFRFVNNNDIVTRVPPILMGYRHCGREVYLNRNGKMGKLSHLARRRDRWRGFFRGLSKWKIDHFSDHSIHNYIDAILKAVEEENLSMSEGGAALDAALFTGKVNSDVHNQHDDDDNEA